MIIFYIFFSCFKSESTNSKDDVVTREVNENNYSDESCDDDKTINSVYFPAKADVGLNFDIFIHRDPVYTNLEKLKKMIQKKNYEEACGIIFEAGTNFYIIPESDVDSTLGEDEFLLNFIDEESKDILFNALNSNVEGFNFERAVQLAIFSYLTGKDSRAKEIVEKASDEQIEYIWKEVKDFLLKSKFNKSASLVANSSNLVANGSNLVENFENSFSLIDLSIKNSTICYEEIILRLLFPVFESRFDENTFEEIKSIIFSTQDVAFSESLGIESAEIDPELSSIDDDSDYE